MAGRLSARFAYRWLVAGVVVTVLAVAGAFTALGQNLAGRFTEDPRVNAQHIELALANEGAVRLGAFRSLVFVAIACAIILLLARRTLAPKVAGWALVAMAAVDLWSVERSYWQFSPPAAVLYQKDATIDFLQKVQQPSRVLTLGIQGAPMNPYDPFLRRDALMIHRVRITLGYHGNSLGRYDMLRSSGPDKENDQLFNPTFWALTNTEFLLLNSDSLPLEGAKRIIGPVRNAAGSNVSLFLLPGEHPFAWVTGAIAKYPDDAVAEALHAANFPVHSVALFDTSSKVQGVQLTAAPAPLNLPTRVTKYEPGHFVVALSAPAPKGAALVVSENFYPGWRASVDGRAATAERADLVLMGVALPEGAREVEFVFASDTYARGKAITLLAIAVALIAALAGGVSDRRRAAVPANA